MSQVLRVEHVTDCRYDAAVDLAHHVAFMTPLQGRHQAVQHLQWQITPRPDFLEHSTDVFGNVRSVFTLAQPHTSLRIQVSSQVQPSDPFGHVQLAQTPAWEVVRERLRFEAEKPFVPASEFAFDSPYAQGLDVFRDYALASFGAGRPIGEAAFALMQRMYAEFRFSPAATQVHTPALQAFQGRAGVCQDFAHIMIACLRSLGLAARYVSGYLLTHPAPGQMRLRGADASHAWVSLWVGEHWLEFDPTNQKIPGMDYVRTAFGRDYGDVAPLRGVIRGGAGHTLAVGVTVEPLMPQ